MNINGEVVPSGLEKCISDHVPTLDEVGQHTLHVQVQVHLHCQPLVHRLVLHLFKFGKSSM